MHKQKTLQSVIMKRVNKQLSKQARKYVSNEGQRTNEWNFQETTDKR